jgi:hypothetical protein
MNWGVTKCICYIGTDVSALVSIFRVLESARRQIAESGIFITGTLRSLNHVKCSKQFVQI